jgi:hypothetical protein
MIRITLRVVMWIITADDGLKVRILLFFDLIG